MLIPKKYTTRISGSLSGYWRSNCLMREFGVSVLPTCKTKAAAISLFSFTFFTDLLHAHLLHNTLALPVICCFFTGIYLSRSLFPWYVKLTILAITAPKPISQIRGIFLEEWRLHVKNLRRHHAYYAQGTSKRPVWVEQTEWENSGKLR